MGASKEDKEKQINAIAALPTAKSKAQAMRRGKYAESTVRHATTRTMQRISKSGFADKLQQHGLDADRVARKLKELLDNADPKTQLNVVRLWCEIFDIVDKDKAKVVNTVVIAMNAVIQSCVAPEKRPEAFQRFGDSLGGH